MKAKDASPSGEGTYIHEAESPYLLTLNEGRATERVFVQAERYMEIRKERDDCRRTLALINAWRLRPGKTNATLEKLLAQVGFCNEDGHAMNALI